jgi:hypothetical protein
MAKAVRRSGEIWLSMSKEIYTEENRKMKGIGAQMEMEPIELMKPTIDKETGELVMENDLSNADFDVTVDVGPSSSSKRQSVVRSLLGMMQITQDPETVKVLSAMAMMNMEGEGIGEVRDFFRKQLVQMGVVKPTAEEEEAMMAAAGQQEDPNAIFLQAAAEEAMAKAAKARADVINTIADAEYKQAGSAERNAKTVEIMAKIEEDDQRLAIESAKGIQDIFQRGMGG